MNRSKQKTLSMTHTHTHTHTHTASRDLWTPQPLLDFQSYRRQRVGDDQIRSDHIITKEETGRKPHRVDVDISKFIFVYFILWKKETLFFQKQSHLPLCCWGRVQQFARPHPATTTLQLHIDKTTTIASWLANNQTVELSLIFSVSIRLGGCWIRI